MSIFQRVSGRIFGSPFGSPLGSDEGIPRQNLLAYFRGGEDIIGLSVSQYSTVPITGTAYYLDSSCEFNGDGSSPDPATANGQPGPHNSIANMRAARTYQANTVLYVKRGLEYTGSLYISGLNNPITFLPYGTGHPPIILGNGNYAVELPGKSNITYYGMWFKTRVYCYNGCTNVRFLFCICSDSPGHGFRADGSNVEFVNCIATNNSFAGFESIGADVSLVNCISALNLNRGLRSAVSGVLSHSNCCITGNGLTLESNVVQEEGSTITDLGDRVTKNPLFTDYGAGQSEFVLTFDNKDIAYWIECAALFPSGLKATFFLQMYELDSLTTLTAEEIAAVQSLIADGHEIGIHTATHSDLRADTLFVVTSTNTSPTIDIDIAGDQIILNCDEVGNQVTVADISTKNIDDLKTAVAGKGWTITNATAVFDAVILDSVNDSSGEQILPYDATSNVTAPDYRYWRNEILVCRDYITDTFGYTPTTLAYPSGYYTDELLAWVKDVAGLFAARGYNTGYTAISRSLSAVNIYLSSSTDKEVYSTAIDENSAREFADNIYAQAMTQGINISFLTHRPSDISAANLGYILDELVNQIGVEFKTYYDFIASIKASHSTSDGYTYTKEYPRSDDLSLQSASPCIGTGTKDALTGTDNIIDTAGYKVYDGTYQLPDGHWIDGVDIGAYAYGGASKVYPKIANPSEGVWVWESAPDILDITGVGNAVYNLDGTGIEFATEALAFAAFASLADDVQIFAGDTQIAIYSTDQSAIADKINRRLK